MEQYAYIRVSTKEQNVDRQIIALSQFDIPKKNIFCDHQSGKDFDRPAYKKLIKKLRPGDLLIVKSIDRLGRDYDEILLQWQYITKDVKADIVVLDMELLDTRKKDNNLTGLLISDLVLQIFAYVAQIEREFIHQRQAEGIAAAKIRGQRFGRKRIPIPDDFEDICTECKEKGLTTRKGAEKLGLSHSTFCRRYNEWREVLPFGRFVELYNLYYGMYGGPSYSAYLGSIKFLRNAAAHNVCLLNSLRKPYAIKINKCMDIMDALSKSKKFETSYKSKMENPVIHDFVVMLFVYYDALNTVGNRSMRERGMSDVRRLFFETMLRGNNRTFFEKNDVLVSDYRYICRVIEYLENCRNRPVLKK